MGILTSKAAGRSTAYISFFLDVSTLLFRLKDEMALGNCNILTEFANKTALFFLSKYKINAA
jgi:hypothetical protein